MRLLTSSARSVVEPLQGTNTRAADLYAWQQLGACQPQRSDQAVLYRSAAASPPSRSQRILGSRAEHVMLEVARFAQLRAYRAFLCDGRSPVSPGTRLDVFPLPPQAHL